MDLDQFLARLPRGDLWVYGYGSLMWAPGFRYAERAVARAYGYHRSLCILSHRHRGTRERPGLVMGLCPGGSCWGVAFRIARERTPQVLAMLWEREMRNRVYRPRLVRVRLGAPGARAARHVAALAFTADTRHRQFAGELSLAGRARLVAQGRGERGRCIDYIRNTLAHMRTAGLRDPHLDRILAAALALPARGKAAPR